MSRVQFVAAALTALVVGTGAELAAQEMDMTVETSTNAAIVSDYVFRGISQTLEQPAIQGGIDIAFPSFPAGIYLGTWGSSLNFGEDYVDLGIAAGDDAQAEIDFYGGIAPMLGPVAVDVGALYYWYPGADDDLGYDFWEAYGSLGYDIGPVSAALIGAWSPEYFAGSGTGVVYGLDASVGIPDTPIGLSAGVAHQLIEDNDAFGTPDYTYYSVGASVGYWGLGFGVSYTGTDLDDIDCFGGSELCEGRVVFSIGSE